MAGQPRLRVNAHTHQRKHLRHILDFIENTGQRGILVRQAGNLGLDSWEPIVQVITPAGPGTGEGVKVLYGRVTPQAARRILQEHVLGGQVVAEFVIPGTCEVSYARV